MSCNVNNNVTAHRSALCRLFLAQIPSAIAVWNILNDTRHSGTCTFVVNSVRVVLPEPSRTIGKAGFFCAVKHQFSVRTRIGEAESNLRTESNCQMNLFDCYFSSNLSSCSIMKPLQFISAEFPHWKVVKIMLSCTQNRLTSENIEAGNHSQNCDWLWVFGSRDITKIPWFVDFKRKNGIHLVSRNHKCIPFLNLSEIS